MTNTSAYLMWIILGGLTLVSGVYLGRSLCVPQPAHAATNGAGASIESRAAVMAHDWQGCWVEEVNVGLVRHILVCVA